MSENPGAEPLETAEADDTTGRFAAYDNRLARFVGGVHDTKAKAKAAAKRAGVSASDTEVRTV